MTIQQDHPVPEESSGLIRTTIRGNTLQVAGELDLETSTHLFTSAVFAAEPDERVLIDMAEVTFMDSTAIGVLVRVSRERPVQIVNPSEPVRRILEITGLTEWFGLDRGTDGPTASN
jgi:anti-sigma B factor antagonist